MTRKKWAAAAATATVLAAGGVTVAATTAGSAASGDRNCAQTAHSVDHFTGYTYLYGRHHCKGKHDAKDNGNDSDYGDGKGKIKHFDNSTDSIINNSSRTLQFFNKPHYQGENFCVAPGRWVNRLSWYSDSKGSWSNSISSHRWLKDTKSCDRWFGRQTPRNPS